MEEEAGCQVRLHSKLYSKPCSHLNHLIGGLCRFLALVQTVPEKSETLVLVPKVILIISTAVLGTNPTGPGLTLCKIHQFKLKGL